MNKEEREVHTDICLNEFELDPQRARSCLYLLEECNKKLSKLSPDKRARVRRDIANQLSFNTYINIDKDVPIYDDELKVIGKEDTAKRQYREITIFDTTYDPTEYINKHKNTELGVCSLGLYGLENQFWTQIGEGTYQERKDAEAAFLGDNLVFNEDPKMVEKVREFIKNHKGNFTLEQFLKLYEGALKRTQISHYAPVDNPNLEYKYEHGSIAKLDGKQSFSIRRIHPDKIPARDGEIGYSQLDCYHNFLGISATNEAIETERERLMSDWKNGFISEGDYNYLKKEMTELKAANELLSKGALVEMTNVLRDKMEIINLGDNEIAPKGFRKLAIYQPIRARLYSSQTFISLIWRNLYYMTLVSEPILRSDSHVAEVFNKALTEIEKVSLRQGEAVDKGTYINMHVSWIINAIPIKYKKSFHFNSETEYRQYHVRYNPTKRRHEYMSITRLGNTYNLKKGYLNVDDLKMFFFNNEDDFNLINIKLVLNDLAANDWNYKGLHVETTQHIIKENANDIDITEMKNIIEAEGLNPDMLDIYGTLNMNFTSYNFDDILEHILEEEMISNAVYYVEKNPDTTIWSLYGDDAESVLADREINKKNITYTDDYLYWRAEDPREELSEDEVVVGSDYGYYYKTAEAREFYKDNEDEFIKSFPFLKNIDNETIEDYLDTEIGEVSVDVSELEVNLVCSFSDIINSFQNTIQYNIDKGIKEYEKVQIYEKDIKALETSKTGIPKFAYDKDKYKWYTASIDNKIRKSKKEHDYYQTVLISRQVTIANLIDWFKSTYEWKFRGDDEEGILPKLYEDSEYTLELPRIKYLIEYIEHVASKEIPYDEWDGIINKKKS